MCVCVCVVLFFLIEVSGDGNLLLKYATRMNQFEPSIGWWNLAQTPRSSSSIHIVRGEEEI